MKSLLNITMEEYIEIQREEAREEALKKARQEKLEAARKMKEAGLSVNQIKTFIGLSPSVIKKL